MMKIDEPGWIEIGKRCSADRRSVWVRMLDASGKPAVSEIETPVRTIELCAGREGDDAFVVITKDNPQWASLLDLYLVAVYAATT